MGRILNACNEYPDKRNAIRLRALILLLRYSGLRFTDAAKLSRDRITGDNLLLYTAKTGTPVNCPLPPIVIAALAAIPVDGPYYFWTGKSATKGLAGSIWWRPLHRLFALAKVPNGHAHRFRDTFAVELLLAGVPIDRVSVLLGHKSVRTYREALCPLGPLQTGAAGSRCAQDLGDRRSSAGTPRAHEEKGDYIYLIPGRLDL